MTQTTDAFGSETLPLLRERIALLQEKHASTPNRRIIISLAGVPGSGKSTISAALLASLQSTTSPDAYHSPRVAVVPMDGYHYPKHTLSQMADPAEAFARRGAPFTFDAEAFVETIIRLKETPVTETDDVGLAVRLPGFDHAVQDPVAEAINVSSATQVLVVEGNYLLLDEEPWRRVRGVVDEAWFVDVPAEVAKERLVRRHIEAGIETTVEAAAARAESNDLKNGELIRRKLIEPDVLLRN